MIRSREHIWQMAPYALADPGGPETISLAQNESAFPPSPRAVEAGRLALQTMHLYPDPDWGDLRSAVTDRFGLRQETILCGAGSMELIGCLLRAFTGPGDRVLGTDYGYAYVASAAAQVEADYVKAREIDLTVSVNDVFLAVEDETKIVFVCNPGNPTGTMIANEDLVWLRDALPDHILLVIDQAYAEFADSEQNPSVLFGLVDRGNTVVLRTFSKAYGLAGARVGWGVLPPEIAIEVRKLLNPNNVSVVSQAMAAAALWDHAYMQEVVYETAMIRDRFADECRALGMFVPPSHTNFVLLRFASAQLAGQIDQALRDENLLMRGMGGYGLDDCLRATIREEAVMKRCLSVMKRVMS